MASTKLVNVLMEPELVERLDDYRFEKRFPSRAAAIKWLLTWALDQQPQPGQESGQAVATDAGQLEAAA